VATVDECEHALHGLAAKLAANDGSTRKAGFDRRLTCKLRDLDVIFGGRLHDGLLTGITRADQADGQVRLTMTSDDLLALVDGSLKIASAWATGRIKVEAGVMDLLKLRTIF
jgi:putative sterol carrier protein